MSQKILTWAELTAKLSTFNAAEKAEVIAKIEEEFKKHGGKK